MNLAERFSGEFSDNIDDFVFFSKENDYRLYIKPKTEEITSNLREKVEVFLRENSIPVNCYFVSNIPYVNGTVDVDKLKSLSLINQDLIASFKKSKNLLHYELSIEDSKPEHDLNPIESYLKTGECLADQNEDNDIFCHTSLFQAPEKPSLIKGVTLPRERYQKSFQNILFDTANFHSGNFIKFITSDNEVNSVTYKELLEQACLILQIITQQGFRKKDIIILHLESSIEFIKIFWACMLGGIVVLPILPTEIVDASDATIKNLFYLESELGKLNIFAEHAFLESLSKHQNTLNFNGVAIEDLCNVKKQYKETELPKIEPDSYSIVLMTSGSTGKPKLVLHTHASLIARSIATIEHNYFSSSDTSLNWFGFDHVGALVMFHIRDVVIGANQVHVGTDHILEDPIRWLDYLSQYKITATWAPNFAYALILEKLANVKRRINFDLSSIRFILNGGESINFDVANNFLETLSQYGLKKDTMHPAWGMSETASGVIYADYLINIKSLDSVSYTSIGTPIPGCELRVVDRKNNIVPMGYPGKLQIKGPSVMYGYIQDANRNQSSFTNDSWFNTGDLAAITAYGLCIVGREKDILIINGKNYSCTNLENEIRQIEGIVPDCICLLPLFNKKT
ncbi:MAG: AMP-binding protein, partial [Candidatus Thorarchaeota archaeon]